MALLTPTTLSSSRFTWIAGEQELVAEISDFGRDFRFGQVYDDACDEGITIRSEHTGRTVVFGMEDVVRDSDGDLLYWLLKPAPGQDLTGCRCAAVRIFND